MRYLGIDYGSKRIGLAVSDADGKIAFPREVLENKGEATLRHIAMFCDSEKVGAIVLGKSLNYKQEANPIQAQIENFKLKIEKLTGMTVDYQNEVLTSHQAMRVNKDKEGLDARSAALILQSYLDHVSRD